MLILETRLHALRSDDGRYTATNSATPITISAMPKVRAPTAAA